MIDQKLRSDMLAALGERADFPLTEKRIAVLDEIVRNPDFEDAEAIWLAVRKTWYKTSRATVYHTISTLVDLGFIRREKSFSYGYKYYLNRPQSQFPNHP